MFDDEFVAAENDNPVRGVDIMSGQRRMRRWMALALVAGTTVQQRAHAPPFSREELRMRRTAVLERIGDGLLLIHAAGGMKRWEESGFHQDPSFYYLTGLINAQNAVLLLDGAHRVSWLFVPPSPRRIDSTRFVGPDRWFIRAGREAEEELAIDHVLPWESLGSTIDSLLGTQSAPTLFVDAGGQTGAQLGRQSNPADILPVSNPYVLWRSAVEHRWPRATVKDAWPLLDAVRSVKSPAELVELRRAAVATGDAIVAVARAIRPSVTQHELEGVAIAAAAKHGSDGPSLWPWIRSGDLSKTNVLFDAFYDYANLDRVMHDGDVVRVDLGFDSRGYKGDAGRTFPVSGRFTMAQQRGLALLNGAYQAGATALREGFSPESVVTRARSYLREHAAEVVGTPDSLAIAQLLATTSWPLHGLGLDLAEGTPAVFHAGNVICFEPKIRVDGQDLFVEDTFLITPTGHEVLNPPIPYAPNELEKLMTSRKSPP